MVLSTTSAPYMEILYRERIKNSKNFTHHRINFGEIASAFTAMGYGFGVERIDFARKSRKNVQQTRGIIDKDGDVVPGTNLYVDTWWTAPPTISLAGVTEMPAGKDIKVCYWDEEGKIGQRQMFSYLDCLEKMYAYNNNPAKVANDEVWLLDFMKKQFYKITFKGMNTNVSVDRPNLLIFRIDVDVLEETSSLTKPYQRTKSLTDQVFSSITTASPVASTTLRNTANQIIGVLT